MMKLLVAAGFGLALLAAQLSAFAFTCGNGIVEPGEDCDDNNLTSGDGCSSTCQSECPASLTGTWTGVVQSIMEVDITASVVFAPDGTITGNFRDSRGTIGALSGTRSGASITLDLPPAASGTIDAYGGACHIDVSFASFLSVHLVYASASYCGDGTQNAGEACDDGDSDDGDGCSIACTNETCGNGAVEPAIGEQCDGNSDDCDVNCTFAVCGNGIVNPGEQCDDGNLADGDDCDHACGIPGCPNGSVGPGEDCDDGNLTDNDGCARNCRFPGCGNFIVETGETCDDGNTVGGDYCAADCGVTTTTTTTLPGLVPSTLTSWRCEDAVLKNASKLATSLFKCQRKVAKAAAHGRTYDRVACEEAARAAFDRRNAATFANGCPPCAASNSAGLGAAIGVSAYDARGRTFCEGTVPLP